MKNTNKHKQKEKRKQLPITLDRTDKQLPVYDPLQPLYNMYPAIRKDDKQNG